MSEKIGYLIASNHYYVDVAVPKLLESMKYISPEDITVSISRVFPKSENRVYYETVIGGIEYLSNNLYCFEYSAIIDLLERRPHKYDWVFLLHDTCEVGPNFEKLTKLFPRECDICWVSRGVNNFAMYRVNYLHQCYDYFKSLEDIDKENAITNEGYIYRNYLHKKAEYHSPDPIVKYQKDIYKTGTDRITEYFRGVDLYKYKSNWFPRSEKGLEWIEVL